MPSKRLLKWLGLYLTTTFITSLYSGNLNISFLGIYPFYVNSFLSVLCVSVFFIYACSLKKDNISIVIDLIIWTSAVAGIYGVLQYFGLDFLNWSGRFGSRVWSTMGNPNFLAGYLCIISPLGIYWYLKKGKVHTALSVGIILIALILTSSRSGILAGLAGILFVVILTEKSKAEKNRLRNIIVIFLTVFILIGVFEFKGIKSIGRRYLSTFNFKEINIASRFSQWNSGAKMFLQKPVFGWGRNGYYMHFRKYMKKEFIDYSSYLSVPGYPHNYFIRLLVNGGILFSGIILAWWVYIVYFLFQQRKKSRGYTIAVCGSFIAMAVNNMFTFNSIATVIIFWIILGTGIACFSGVEINIKKYKMRNIFLGLLIFPVFLSFRYLWADHLFYLGRYRQAAKKAPSVPKYRMTYAKTLFVQDKLEQAEKIFKIQIKKTPFFALAYNGLGMVYYKSNKLNKAINQFKKSLKRDPHLVDARINIAKVYREEEDFEKAMVHYKKALQIKPDLSNPRYNLGVIYFKKGEIEKAEKEWKQVLKYNPDHKKARQSLNRIH